MMENKKINTISELIDFIVKFEHLATELEIIIDEQSKLLNIYEQNIYLIGSVFITYSGFILKNKEEIFKHYKKDNTSDYYTEYNNAISSINSKRESLLNKFKTTKFKESFVSDDFRYYYNLWNKLPFIRFLFKSKNHPMLTKEEDSKINKMEIILACQELNLLIENEPFSLMETLNDKDDYVVYKSYSKNKIKRRLALLSDKSNAFSDYLKSRTTFNFIKRRIVKRFKSKYLEKIKIRRY